MFNMALVDWVNISFPCWELLCFYLTLPYFPWNPSLINIFPGEHFNAPPFLTGYHGKVCLTFVVGLDFSVAFLFDPFVPLLYRLALLDPGQWSNLLLLFCVVLGYFSRVSETDSLVCIQGCRCAGLNWQVAVICIGHGLQIQVCLTACECSIFMLSRDGVS